MNDSDSLQLQLQLQIQLRRRQQIVGTTTVLWGSDPASAHALLRNRCKEVTMRAAGPQRVAEDGAELARK